MQLKSDNLRLWLTSSCLIRAVGAWLGLTLAAVSWLALPGSGPNTRAVLMMGLGLVLSWVVLGGWLMFHFRQPIRRFALALPVDWRIKFVAFTTLLALTEEAITTTLTNLAPLFGVPYGSAYITASGSYLDVVLLHSVVVFAPMFIAWAFLLSRFAFSPNAVFLLFGLTGTLGEATISNGQAFAEIGMWIFVYGLMVYLPAYSLPERPNARRPRWWHYILAVFVPLLFAIPVAMLVSSLHPYPVHFPPIPPGS